MGRGNQAGKKPRVRRRRTSRRHRIMAAGAPGLAAPDALERQITALECAVRLQRANGVQRAGGLEPARRAQPRAQQQTISLDDGNQETDQHDAPVLFSGDKQRAAANNCCNSWRTANFRTSELALVNNLRSKPLRSRTTCAAQASADSNSRLTA